MKNNESDSLNECGFIHQKKKSGKDEIQFAVVHRFGSQKYLIVLSFSTIGGIRKPEYLMSIFLGVLLRLLCHIEPKSIGVDVF